MNLASYNFDRQQQSFAPNSDSWEGRGIPEFTNGRIDTEPTPPSPPPPLPNNLTLAIPHRMNGKDDEGIRILFANHVFFSAHHHSTFHSIPFPSISSIHICCLCLSFSTKIILWQ
jgi:hypothetical protein